MRKVYLMLAFSTFILFVFFSYLVSKELFNQFDFNTTVKLQDRISRAWDTPFSFFSLIGSIEITAFLWLGLSIWMALKRYWWTLISLSFFISSHIIEVFGKLLLFHPSPPLLFFRGVAPLPFQFPSHYVHTDYSYPSGHSMRTAFLVVFLFFLAEHRLRGPARLIAQSFLAVFLFVMLLSRVYLGEHWTTDVIGGALLGTAAALIAVWALPKFKVQK
ncbi:phosphatase PAP2 family protein [Candidatus Microgenomates bacterium]|nr:phosphatase PAP2 family protein [Candidatus Microgenomates bacterium]